jgi:DNA primase
VIDRIGKRDLAQRLACGNPLQGLASVTIFFRRGRIIVDYLPSGRSTTAIGTYSRLAWEVIRSRHP